MSLEKFLEEARRKAVSGKLPPTWKPAKEGDELYGVIVDAYPNPWDSNITSYTVRTPSGEERMTPRNVVLNKLLQKFNPEVGDLLYIKYEGEGKRKPGTNPPKIFSVYVKKASEPFQPEEEGVEVLTAKEVEEKKTVEADLREAVTAIKNLKGATLERGLFEALLKSRGFDMQAEEVAKLLPGIVRLTKRGVYIEDEKK